MTDVRHFLDLKDVPAHDLRSIIDAARRIKDARKGRLKGALDDDPLLSDVALGMVFAKPSTRTRLSFDMAVHQGGGRAISLENSQMGRGETPGDTAQVLSRMVDIVAARLGPHSDIEEMAATSSVPIVNALTDRSHPCQLMADVLTIEEHLGSIAGKSVAWLGDGNNMVVSLVEAATAFGFSVRIMTPDGYGIDSSVIETARAAGTEITLTADVAEGVSGADIVMTDTWISMGDSDADQRCRDLAPFAVTEGVMAKAAEGALFMHCLPAHRGDEVTNEVIDGPQSIVWDTAENRLHVQKAIMAWCLGRI